MKINKVLILGIDAIEYNLVERWDLKNLKQKEYGRTELPLYPGEEPNTRIIWPCFITGKMPKNMGYVTHRVFKPPLQHFVNIFLPKIKFIFNPQSNKPFDIIARKKSSKIRILNAYALLEKLKLVTKPSRNHIQSSTIFDIISDSIHFHIPIYDEYIPPYAERTVEAIEDKHYRPIFEMQCKQEFSHRAKEVLEWLERKNKWNLFMQYFWLLDGIQHAFFNNTSKIAKFYLLFDELVGKIQRKMGDEELLLIVSDHGQEKGVHTNYGFYSVNVPLGLEHPKLIDFRWIIQDLLSSVF